MQWEVLDTQRHRDLGIAPIDEADRLFVQIVTGEFAVAAADHPVLFAKHPETGRFYAGVLLRLKAGEASAAADAGGYRPADLQRQGFFVDNDRIVIDRSHPAFVAGSGAPLFDADGEATDRFRAVQHALGLLHTGLPTTDAFIDRLLDHDLLEPIDIRLNFDDGEQLVLQDLYTISLDALAVLEEKAAVAMLRSGDLALCYIQAQSVRRITGMARERNNRLGDLPR